MTELKQLAAEAAELIKKSRKTIALTGAGISTESGIPDFRSKGTGLWEKFDPMQMSSVSALLSNLKQFYDFNLKRWSSFRDARPNIAHIALAELESHGFLYSVITQNIDGLHIKAGSKRVWEVHGHLRTCHCMKCRSSYPYDELLNQYDSGINPPKCECGGILRPDVVLFEDPLGVDFNKAIEDLAGCELLIVVGSSLRVYPVASLPRYARKMIIINKEPTPWDGSAQFVVNESAGRFFEELLSQLGI